MRHQIFHDAVRQVRAQIADEPWERVIVTSAAGASLVLHQTGSVATKAHECSYRLVTIIGGHYDAFELTQATGLPAMTPQLKLLELTGGDWQRLATGRMSATELFGWRDEPGGLSAAAIAYDADAAVYATRPEAIAVGEKRADYYATDPVESAVIEEMRRLGDVERDIVLRMVRGLKR